VTWQAGLFAAGAVIEFVGIVLLGFPDFVPGAVRLSQWLRVSARRVANRLRRVVRLPPRPTVVTLEGLVHGRSMGRASVTVAVSPGATLEEEVAFLLRRDQESQNRINALTERVAEIEGRTPAELEQLRARMEAHVAQELAAARDEYRPLRIVGTIALALGLICMSVANFL
jgi:hypothetical protein